MSKNLEEISTLDLQQEMQRRQRSLRTLERKRERLVKQLREVEAEIAEAGGTLASLGGAVSVRKRPKNEMNLADALFEVLKDQTMSVTEVAEEVQRQGYKTTSPNFRTIVNQTLIKDGRFRREGRGKYTAAAGGGKTSKKRNTRRTSR